MKDEKHKDFQVKDSRTELLASKNIKVNELKDYLIKYKNRIERIALYKPTNINKSNKKFALLLKLSLMYRMTVTQLDIVIQQQ